jgi:large subunit ribosomal protein L23
MSIFNKKTDASASSSAKASEDKKAKRVEPKTESMKDLYEGKSKVVVDAKGETKKIVKTDRFDKAYKILVKPLVTEKAANLGISNKYVFAVNVGANKIEIAKSIEQVYGIKPLSVNVIRIEGKKARYGKTKGKRKDWKKAIVKLPAGKTIKVYEGV